MSEKRMDKRQTVPVVGVVVAQSAQVNHVLVQDACEVRYAVTRKRFRGDWSALRCGDVVELVATKEQMPEVLGARPAAVSSRSSL
jgi:hypothetical protein